MERIQCGADGRGFFFASSGRRFTPWGFNYDHDENERLLEDYWSSEWSKVEEDFLEMKELGANVVRVHLQVGKFLRSPKEADEDALHQLSRLVALAERLGLYLDLTGLGCYRKADVPGWYDRLAEAGRWEAQAFFWEALALRCAASPAVFCYDLMNEPVVPGGRREAGDWLGPPFAGKFHYVQCISLDQANRPREEIAAAWIRRLASAIRTHDSKHLITVGLVPWSLDRPGLTSGFIPPKIAPELDFLSVHLYPEALKLDDARRTLEGFRAGKPLLIEETFPLQCGFPEFRQFLTDSKKLADGWVGFYWGKTLRECRASGEMADALLAGWLEIFQEEAKP